MNDRKSVFFPCLFDSLSFLQFANGKKIQKLENNIATSLDKIEKTWLILSLLPREINLDLLSYPPSFQLPWCCLASSCVY